MEVLVAASYGMCFGVRDAIRTALEAPTPASTTILGELVHNPEVTSRLAARGFRQVPESTRKAPVETPVVMITAHGVSDKCRNSLLASGKTLVDTTCPLVLHVHNCARRFRDEGRFVVVIGKPGHVEVEGIVEDLDRFAVLPSPADVCDYGESRIGIVCQSTMRPAHAERAVAAVRAANPRSDIEFADTICRPTRDRQGAVLRLLPHIDILVVVGGEHSNNARQLVQIAESRGIPAVLVERASSIDHALLQRHRVAGLTAGTSTLESTIHDVHQALLAIRPANRATAPDATDAILALHHACNSDEACF
jgi:4-hydroxy-3-methylbut-2-enyl diphosphate reductase